MIANVLKYGGLVIYAASLTVWIIVYNGGGRVRRLFPAAYVLFLPSGVLEWLGDLLSGSGWKSAAVELAFATWGWLSMRDWKQKKWDTVEGKPPSTT